MDRNCKLCKLGCGKAVPSHGPTRPKIMVVSDYPGKKEMEVGQHMVGKAGSMLRRALGNLVGLDPEQDVYFMSVLRCDPGDASKDQLKGPITACRRWTVEDLRAVECDVVLITGDLAFETLLPHVVEQEKAKDPDFNLSRGHGMVFQHLGKTYMITWSPNMVERNKFKRLTGWHRGKPIAEDWHPRGSVPDLFKRDLLKLRELLVSRGFTPRENVVVKELAPATSSSPRLARPQRSAAPDIPAALQDGFG